MKKIILSLLAIFCGFAFSITPASAQYSDISKAQTGLRKTPLSIVSMSGKHEFTVEIADTFAKQEIGLMWRTQMADNAGMLFDYAKTPHKMAFWMRNTVIPLDIIYISPKGKIISISANAIPFDETPLWSNGIAAGVLEINGGLSKKLGIHVGDYVYHPIFKNARK